MNLVDTNVLVYAVDSSAPHHVASRRWLDDALSGSATVGFAWLAIVGFLRVTTLPNLVTRPLTGEAALGIVDAWLGARPARILQPGHRHPALLRQLMADGRDGNLANDAHT